MSNTELYSALEFAKYIVNNRFNRNLEKHIKAIAKIKAVRGEHLDSIFRAAIRLMKAAELKLNLKWNLAKVLIRQIFPNQETNNNSPNNCQPHSNKSVS